MILKYRKYIKYQTLDSDYLWKEKRKGFKKVGVKRDPWVSAILTWPCVMKSHLYDMKFWRSFED